MPTTVVGLVVFVAFLIPGFVFSQQRRRDAVKPKVSPLAETASFLAVSVVTNMGTALLFAIVRFADRYHAPDFGAMLRHPVSYTSHRPGYLLVWVTGFFAVSIVLAYLLGRASLGTGWLATLSGHLWPVVADYSAWHQLFSEEAPDDARVFVSCLMRNGSYVMGYLDWYNTDIEESPSRDIAISRPIFFSADGEEMPASEVPRTILSAGNIARMDVTYVISASVGDQEEFGDSDNDEVPNPAVT